MKKLIVILSLCLLSSISMAKYQCPVPSTQLSSSMFILSSDKHSASARVSDPHQRIVWEFYIDSPYRTILQSNIENILSYNNYRKEAFAMLGCLDCTYQTPYSGVKFRACGRSMRFN